jgi:hypothetical protein
MFKLVLIQHHVVAIDLKKAKELEKEIVIENSEKNSEKENSERENNEMRET